MAKITKAEDKAAAIRGEAARILAARGNEREAMLVESDSLPAIVPLLPPEELLFTLRDADRDAAVTILSHALTAQLQAMLDLELWSRDRLRPERAQWWLRLMEECGEAPLSKWLRKMDSAELSVLLSPLIRAHIVDGEGEAPEGGEEEAVFSLDAMHYFVVPAKIEDAVRKILIHLRMESHQKYLHVIETALVGFDPEKEEEAFALRNVRIAELGFVPFEEAQAIYLPISPDKFRAATPRAKSAEEEISAAYPVPLAATAPLLKKLLDKIEGLEARAEAARQIANLTHKIVSADLMDAADPKSYYFAGRKAAGFITIGLQALCGVDEERMLSALESAHMEHLFRVGWWRIQQAAAKGREMLKKSWAQGKMERLLILDEPILGPLNGLLRKRPKNHLVPRAEGDFAEFESEAEVSAVEEMVKKGEFIGRFILKAVDFSLGDLKKATTGLDDDNLKGSTVFLTAIVNSALGKGFVFSPVNRGEVADGLSRLWVKNEPPRKVRPDLKKAAQRWSAEIMELAEEEKGWFGEFFDESIRILEEQYGHLSASETPDPRFIKGIWIA